VIVLVAPFVARIVPRVGAKRLLAASFTIAALSMFYYSGFTSQTDYFHFAVARAYQGFGYAFMFVPVTQLAYSYLPKNKNNKGSSLMNLRRTWGASFGISFVTTMLERRTQYHQSVTFDSHGLRQASGLNFIGPNLVYTDSSDKK
jgi:DHA2 family multidrug resistance protein